MRRKFLILFFFNEIKEESLINTDKKKTCQEVNS